jgi:hypothetical protein
MTKVSPSASATISAASLPGTSAPRVRLNLLKTTEGPSIWEFQLFAPAITK